ncbi:MAG: hypothetical protein M0Q90_13365 [Bacteroidales bacterium]|nr:hypothetical protein [Bacteroidales bacterium]
MDYTAFSWTRVRRRAPASSSVQSFSFRIPIIKAYSTTGLGAQAMRVRRACARLRRIKQQENLWGSPKGC